MSYVMQKGKLSRENFPDEEYVPDPVGCHIDCEVNDKFLWNDGRAGK